MAVFWCKNENIVSLMDFNLPKYKAYMAFLLSTVDLVMILFKETVFFVSFAFMFLDIVKKSKTKRTPWEASC